LPEYKVQINVKVGDHLININGETVAEVQEYLHQLAEHSGEIHAAMEKLDGRPATDIVTKEKTWGARSQGGRTYPKTAGASSATSPGGSTPQTAVAAHAASPQQLLQQEMGAQVLGTETNAVASPGAGAPNEVVHCGIHGKPRQFYGPGVSSKTGKEYGASYRCTERGCSAHWQRKDGSW